MTPPGAGWGRQWGEWGRGPRPDRPRPAPPPPRPPALESSYPRSDFEQHVERIRQYIAAGDAFQGVLSQRLGLPLRTTPLQLYRGLRSVNPSPYLFFLELDGLALVGSSPEVLVRLEGDRVTVRPIAGTRARGQDVQEDAEGPAEVLGDRGRTAAGRASRYGSVQVTGFMEIERYSHVLHLVSQVEGELRTGLSATDVFRACFPPGTVSGA